MLVLQEFPGATVLFGNVSDMASLKKAFDAQPVDVVVSCLASRTGGGSVFKHLKGRKAKDLAPDLHSLCMPPVSAGLPTEQVHAGMWQLQGMHLGRVLDSIGQ